MISIFNKPSHSLIGLLKKKRGLTRATSLQSDSLI